MACIWCSFTEEFSLLCIKQTLENPVFQTNAQRILVLLLLHTVMHIFRSGDVWYLLCHALCHHSLGVRLYDVHKHDLSTLFLSLSKYSIVFY